MKAKKNYQGANHDARKSNGQGSTQNAAPLTPFEAGSMRTAPTSSIKPNTDKGHRCFDKK